jgi:hypothetical protein
MTASDMVRLQNLRKRLLAILAAMIEQEGEG